MLLSYKTYGDAVLGPQVQELLGRAVADGHLQQACGGDRQQQGGAVVAGGARIDIAAHHLGEHLVLHHQAERAAAPLALEILVADVEVGVAIGVDVGHEGLDAVGQRGVVVGRDGHEMLGGEPKVGEPGAVGDEGGHLAEQVAGGEGEEVALLVDVVDDHRLAGIVAEDAVGEAVVGADKVLLAVQHHDERPFGGLRRADIDDVDGAGREVEAGVADHKDGIVELVGLDTMGDVNHLGVGDIGIQLSLYLAGKEIAIAPIGGERDELSVHDNGVLVTYLRCGGRPPPVLQRYTFFPNSQLSTLNSQLFFVSLQIHTIDHSRIQTFKHSNN